MLKEKGVVSRTYGFEFFLIFLSRQTQGWFVLVLVVNSVLLFYLNFDD